MNWLKRLLGQKPKTEGTTVATRSPGTPSTAPQPETVLLAALNTWDLRGVVHLVFDGCGDDSFADVVGWILMQPSEVARRIIEDPECFIDHIPDDPEELFEHGHGRFAELIGTPWEEDDLRSRFPRVAAWVQQNAPL